MCGMMDAKARKPVHNLDDANCGRLDDGDSGGQGLAADTWACVIKENQFVCLGKQLKS